VENKALIQTYLNNIRRHLVPKLRPGIGVSSSFYPASSGGGLLEIQVGPAKANSDVVLPAEPSIGAILMKVPQHAFGGNLSGVKFSGTNIVAEGDRLILIKGDDLPENWSDEAAARDLEMALRRGNTK